MSTNSSTIQNKREKQTKQKTKYTHENNKKRQKNKILCVTWLQWRPVFHSKWENSQFEIKHSEPTFGDRRLRVTSS